METVSSVDEHRVEGGCGSVKQHNHRSYLTLELAATRLHTDGPVECSPSPSSSEDEKIALAQSTSHDSGFSSGESLPKRPSLGGGRLGRSLTLPSATPKRNDSHKSVRFADSVGFDLEQKTVFDEDDWRGKLHSCSSPNFSLMESCQQACSLTVKPINFRIPSPAQSKHLRHTHCVCLRSLSVSDLHVTGVIDVLNLDFDKQVCVRYSNNNWINFSEISTVYLSSNGDDGTVDSFAFTLPLPRNMQVGGKCLFCIRYTVNGTTYWDNNNGLNYGLRCLEQQNKEDPRRLQTKRISDRGVSELVQDHNSNKAPPMRPIWPEYCPKVNFPTFRARGWRHGEPKKTQSPSFY